MPPAKRKITLADYAALKGLPSRLVRLPEMEISRSATAFGDYFQHPDPVVVRMPAIQILGGTFIGLAPDDFIIEDISLTSWSRRAASSPEFSASSAELNPKRLEGQPLILGGQRNYYHWLMNWLSRIYILERDGSLDLFDSLIVNSDLASYQQEFFSLIPPLANKKLIPLSGGESVELSDVVCTQIFPNPIHSPPYIEWLRNKVGQTASPIDSDRIFVSRRDAPQGRRQIVNEVEFARFLEGEGFAEVVLSGYSVQEQAAIFRQAREVIAPHGAGLVNCIFLEPGAKVCEIQASGHYTKVFWSLGILARTMRYELIPCRSVEHGPAYLQDLLVDIDDLRRVLAVWASL
jgi:capsular polysaccharide biosynthesis protein